MAAGGVAVFPSDTVYGVCCDPEDHDAARRMYELKGRPAARSCAVMFFALSHAPWSSSRTSRSPSAWRWKCCCPGR